jgi:hypothetical protein
VFVLCVRFSVFVYSDELITRPRSLTDCPNYSKCSETESFMEVAKTWIGLLSQREKNNIVTCYLGSQSIQRFIARRQLCKYATTLQALLDSLFPLNNGTTVWRCLLCRPCRGYITPVLVQTQLSIVQVQESTNCE